MVKKYISLEHTIRNVVTRKPMGEAAGSTLGTDEFQGPQSSAFFKSVHIAPRKGEEQIPTTTRTTAQRNVGKIESSETMKEDQQLDEFVGNSLEYDPAFQELLKKLGIDPNAVPKTGTDLLNKTLKPPVAEPAPAPTTLKPPVTPIEPTPVPTAAAAAGAETAAAADTSLSTLMGTSLAPAALLAAPIWALTTTAAGGKGDETVSPRDVEATKKLLQNKSFSKQTPGEIIEIPKPADKPPAAETPLRLPTTRPVETFPRVPGDAEQPDFTVVTSPQGAPSLKPNVTTLGATVPALAPAPKPGTKPGPAGEPTPGPKPPNPQPSRDREDNKKRRFNLGGMSTPSAYDWADPRPVNLGGRASRASARIAYGESVEEKVERNSGLERTKIVNVSRPTGPNKLGKQGEIEKKIIDENNQQLARKIKEIIANSKQQKQSMANPLVDTKPDLKHQKPEEY